MTDSSEHSEHNGWRAKAEHSARSGAHISFETGQAAPENPALVENQCTSPFKPQDFSPLAWWRTLPPDAFGDAERLLLQATLDQIEVLHGDDDFAAALEGDPAAAIGVAFSMMPIEEMPLRADIAMTALLQCALERNAAAALVLAQVLGLTILGHSHATELAASWLAYGRRHSTDSQKFSEAEVVLWEAFRERRGNDGDGYHRDGAGLPLEEPTA